MLEQFKQLRKLTGFGFSEHLNNRLMGAVFLIVGIGLIFWATEILDSSSAVLRIAIGLVGVFIAYLGLDRLLKYYFGQDFETGLWLAISWIVIIILAAVFADILPLSESRRVTPEVLFADYNNLNLRPDLFSRHPLGTDNQGLDLLGGSIYGARVSLQVGLGAVGIGLAVGGAIGVISGYFRKAVDSVISVLTDSVLAFPPLILLLALATVLERSPRNMALALAVVGIPTYIRLARANTLVFAQRDFILSARAMGSKHSRILMKEIAPNVILPLLSYAFIIIAVLIVAEASLSFLGIGIQRPNPTWGNMIAAGQDRFDRNPHQVFIPGIIMFLTVFSLNRIGEKARAIWDPRSASIS